MHERFQFDFNDEPSAEYGILVETRPDIPTATENVDSVTIAGRESPIIIKNGTYDDITITVECGFKVDDPDKWGIQVRRIRQWLNGPGTLTFSDNLEAFYKVKLIEIKKFEREGRRYGHFDVDFTCDAFEYVHAGLQEHSVADVLFNPYWTSRPIYNITGTGNCELTVNGSTMYATVADNVSIDTDKMLSYLKGGSLANTTVTGDYADLYLINGNNTINITDGFTLTVVPNWRYL